MAFTEHWLRSFGIGGGLDKLAGLMIGRPRDYTLAESRVFSNRQSPEGFG